LNDLKEQLREKAVEQTKRVFGIFHSKENGAETYFASIGNHELLYAADQ